MEESAHRRLRRGLPLTKVTSTLRPSKTNPSGVARHHPDRRASSQLWRGRCRVRYWSSCGRSPWRYTLCCTCRTTVAAESSLCWEIGCAPTPVKEGHSIFQCESCYLLPGVLEGPSSIGAMVGCGTSHVHILLSHPWGNHSILNYVVLLMGLYLNTPRRSCSRQYPLSSWNKK